MTNDNNQIDTQLFPKEAGFFSLPENEQLENMPFHKERVSRLTNDVKKYVEDNLVLADENHSLLEELTHLNDVLTEISNKFNYRAVKSGGAKLCGNMHGGICRRLTRGANVTEEQFRFKDLTKKPAEASQAPLKDFMGVGALIIALATVAVSVGYALGVS